MIRNGLTLSLIGLLFSCAPADEHERTTFHENEVMAREWNNYFVGEWHQAAEVKHGDKVTNRKSVWVCKQAGEDAFATTSTGSSVLDEGEYVSLAAWNDQRGSLLEFGKISTGESWTIDFKPVGTDKLAGKALCHAHGQQGEGTCTITRQDQNHYTAVFDVKLADGKTMRVTNENTRVAEVKGITFGEREPLSNAVNTGDTWEPSISADGLSLFLATSREGSDDFDIYVAKRDKVSDRWSNVRRLGKAINRGSMDGSPDISADGLTLYFNSSNQNGLGGRDLWMSQRATVDGPWQPATNLGKGINTESFEGWPCISNDGLELVFTSSRNMENELFIARRAKKTDPFGEPKGLGIRGAVPELSPDGRYLFYTDWQKWHGQQQAEIYVVKRGDRSAEFGSPMRLPSPVNTEHDDFSANLSADGKTFIYYSKDRLFQVPIAFK